MRRAGGSRGGGVPGAPDDQYNFGGQAQGGQGNDAARGGGGDWDISADFEVLCVLGEGSFGKVYKARLKKDGALVAVKQIKLGAKSWQDALQDPELLALRALRHPCMVRLMELVRNKKNGSLYYIFEYIDSDLMRLLKGHNNGLQESRAADLTQQMLEGLAYMHGANFIHRDLKPENILYHSESETLRIADLGTARSLRARPPFTDYVGTRWYRAPECLLRDRVYSSPVDMWAAGLIFAELLRGSAVFPGTSTIDQLYKIFTVFGQPGADWPEFVRLADAARFKGSKQQGCGLQRIVPRASPLALGLLTELLSLNPRRRPPAKRALESPMLAQLPPRRTANKDNGGGETTPPPLSPRSVLGDDEDQDRTIRRPSSFARPSSAAPSSCVDINEAHGAPPAASANPCSELDIDLDEALDAILGSTGRSPQKRRPEEAAPKIAERTNGGVDVGEQSDKNFPFTPSHRPDSADRGPACDISADPWTRTVEPSVDDLLDDLFGDTPELGLDDPGPAAPSRRTEPLHDSRPPLPVSQLPRSTPPPVPDHGATGETWASGSVFSAWDAPVTRQSPRPAPLPDSAAKPGSRKDSDDVPTVDGGQWSDSDPDAEAEPVLDGLGTTALGATSAALLRQVMADDAASKPSMGQRRSDAGLSLSKEAPERPNPAPTPDLRRMDRAQSAGSFRPSVTSGDQRLQRPDPMPRPDLSPVCGAPEGQRPSEQAPLSKSRRSAAPERPWEAEESTRLRQIVKRIVRAGTRDKDDLWERVASELGSGRSPKECRGRYKNEYKAHKAKDQAADQDGALLE